MSKRLFDFEEQHESLQNKLEELKKLSSSLNCDLSKEIKLLENRIQEVKANRYQNLQPWEKVLLNRHHERYTVHDYIGQLFTDWIELKGDRRFGDDPAILGGIASFHGIPVTVIGHQKGKNTHDIMRHNFGMPHPEGYRKAQRLMLQAEKFGRPVINFIDTPGAYPGVGAEQRGQSWAIAEILMTLAGLKVPVISIVVGEGGSGGALGLAVADHLIMLSNAVFSVASPEASASILWKDLQRVEEMAAALRLTAQDLLEFGVADEIIDELADNSQPEIEIICSRLAVRLEQLLNQLSEVPADILVAHRQQKLSRVGRFQEL